MLLFDKLHNKREDKNLSEKQDSLMDECYYYLETRKMKLHKTVENLDEGLLSYGVYADPYSKTLQDIEKNIVQGLAQNDRRIEKVICNKIYFIYH